MGETFDPYYKWLAIPPQDQPPHHYRLLGVPLFEPDPDVIESAADQRMSHLRALRGSQQQTLSQRLLNEIAAAKVCLLDARRREAYDRELRHKLAASIPAIVRPPAARPLVVRPPAPAARTSVITIEPRRASLGANRRRRFASAAVLCGLFLAAMVGGGLLIAINRRPQSEVQKAPANLLESAMATPTQPEAAHEPAVSPVENGLAVNDGRPIAVPESEPSSPDWIRGAVLAIDCEAASKMERDGITRFRDLSGQNNDAELHDGIQTAGKVGEGDEKRVRTIF